MSFVETGSRSSPGMIGAPMWGSRAETSRPTSGWGGALTVALRWGAGTRQDERAQVIINDLGAACCQRDRAGREVNDLFRDLVRRDPFAQERLDVLAGDLRVFA